MTSKRSKIFAKQILNSQQADVGSLRLKYFVTTPTPTQQNLNTIVGLATKMTVHPTPPLQKLNRGLPGPQINIYWPQLTMHNVTNNINQGHNNNIYNNNNNKMNSLWNPQNNFFDHI